MATTRFASGSRRSRALTGLRRRTAAAPVASAAVLFALLAAVRVAGAFSFPLMALSVALSAAVLLVLDRDRWADAGIRRFAGVGPVVVCVVVVALVYAETFLATRTAFGADDDNWTAWVPRIFDGLVPGARWADVAAMVLAMGVLVPLVEEVCYRGVLYRAVEQRWNTRTAVVSTAAGWALVHLGDYGLNPLNLRVVCGVLPSVFLMGLALGICRAVTGSALACAVAQGMCNLLLLGAVLLWI
ncbi:CPBP family intramembrane glutamic endopeptidase [Streptomyces sp. NPDC006235]|uniref:CPBP family intramembrane glutamic endopeptidase n=1 Tax=Streptomyces sp. NPDC006235 TaxID=3156736 RepID=UPI0033BC4A09